MCLYALPWSGDTPRGHKSEPGETSPGVPRVIFRSGFIVRRVGAPHDDVGSSEQNVVPVFQGSATSCH
jgi:hypothetical protein